MRAQPPALDHPERHITLRQADQARSDIAEILDELDFVKSQFARPPTRAEVRWIALRATLGLGCRIGLRRRTRSTRWPASASWALRRPIDLKKMRTSSLPSGGGSRALRVIVEHRRVLDQDTVPDLFVGGPHEEKIEKDGVVGLLLTFTWMRPVAPPHAAFGRGLRISLRDRGGISISRRPDLGVLIGARQFDPGFALVDQRADLAEKRVAHSLGLGDVGEMVEHDRRSEE